MKKSIVALGMCALLVTLPNSAMSQGTKTNEVVVKVNSNIITMQEAPAYVDAKTNLTYVPLRFVSEALGAEIEWVNAKTPIKATIDKPVHNEVKVTLNSKKVEVNGKVSDYPGAAVLQSGRTMVPLRVISEGLGAEVKWNPEKGGGGTVEINTPWETPKPGDVPTTPTKPVEPTKPTDTPKNVEAAKLTERQKQYASQVFKLIRFDTSSNTLKVSVPDMKDRDITAGLTLNGKPAQGLELNKLYEFKDVESIKLHINIFGESEGYSVTFDVYTIYSRDKLPPYVDVSKIPDNGDLIVFDQYKNVTTLGAVLKALGLE